MIRHFPKSSCDVGNVAVACGGMDHVVSARWELQHGRVETVAVVGPHFKLEHFANDVGLVESDFRRDHADDDTNDIAPSRWLTMSFTNDGSSVTASFTLSGSTLALKQRDNYRGRPQPAGAL